MVEIAPLLARSAAAHAAQLAIDRYQIDQGPAGPDLGKADFGLHALDPAAQDIAIESYHAVKIAHPQDDVIQSTDLEWGRGHDSKFRISKALGEDHQAPYSRHLPTILPASSSCVIEQFETTANGP